MLAVPSMPSWLFDAVALAFGSWVVWRQFRRGNYWIASGLTAIIAVTAAFYLVPSAVFQSFGLSTSLLALRGKKFDYDRFIATAALVVALLQLGFDFVTKRGEKLSSNSSSEELNRRRAMLNLVRAKWITGFYRNHSTKIRRWTRSWLRYPMRWCASI
jgi:hypothetical protein